MRVYVETNFVMELALLQGEYAECQQLMDLASQRKIELIIPAYSLVEPYETLSRRHAERMKMKTALEAELALLARSATYAVRLTERRSVAELLVESSTEETKRLHDVHDAILSAATVIPLDSLTIDFARECQTDHDLKPQDSIVLASILRNLQILQNPMASCFLNRNSKDFDDPDIIDKLIGYNCKLINNFRLGVLYLKNQIPDCQQ